MRISVSLRSGYPPADPRDAARRMIERAAAARDAGLAALFVGDHHVEAENVYLQNTPMLGRLLAEWGAAPAGALFLLPLWHPVLVAEQVGTLAAIASGRFILQCAIGGGEEQFSGMGVDLRDRRARFEAALPIIRRLLAGEEVTAEGPYVIERARIGLVPAEPVEVWVGGHAGPAIDRAARMGDGWVAAPWLPPAETRAMAARYLERCAVHDRTPSAVAIRRDVHVAATTQQAAAVAEPVLARGYRGFDTASCVVGSATQVAERLQALADDGYTDVVIRHLADDQRAVLASFAQLAEVRRLLGAT